MRAGLFRILLHIFARFTGFFFNDTPTTEIYTLSLHDALPISRRWRGRCCDEGDLARQPVPARRGVRSEEHTSELQSRQYLVCRLLLAKQKPFTFQWAKDAIVAATGGTPAAPTGSS